MSAPALAREEVEFTPRELEILRVLALQVHSKLQALVAAVRLGLIELGEAR